jgi:hypothetical protein
MSLVHRVIVLNKPLKIRGFTLFQWAMMVIAAALAFALGSYVPKEWKLANLPVGFIVGLLIFSAVLVVINALEMRPMAWWKNQFLYRLKFAPTQFLPHPEDARSCTDASIHEAPRKEDTYYVRQQN